MSSQIKEICESISLAQKESIRDLTSGHLNENHLYHPRPMINGRRKSTWSSSQKAHPTLRPFHRLQNHSTKVDRMKDSLVDFTYSTLPELSKRKSTNASKIDPSEPIRTVKEEHLPPIQIERIEVPSFSIDLSEEQRLKKLRKFNDNVLQKSDVNLHGLGYSEDFVAYVEQNLIIKLITIESENKRQTLSLNRLQAYGQAMSQLIEGSLAFGPILERIKNEYEFYLDYLLSSQPDYGSHIAEQLKRLRQAQPNFSVADSELFDITRIEGETRQALEKNRSLNEELKRIQREQIEKRAEKSARLLNLPSAPTEIKIKSQPELIDEMRENIFDLLDRMTMKKKELAENFVPLSICTQLQQAVRDTEMDIVKTQKQNETLINELQLLEQRIENQILSHDQTEFVQENVQQIIQLLRKIDLLHLKKSISPGDESDERYFLHTYDDYFS